MNRRFAVAAVRLLGAVSAALVVLASPAPARASSALENPFVRPAELERDVAFWRRVYTEVSTDGGFLHDNERLDIVYDVLGFAQELSPARRTQRIDDAKEKVVRSLRRLSQREVTPDAEDLRIKALWPEGTTREQFGAAADRVRYQLGQANRFREGLVRSGTWMPTIARTFEQMGLPRELAALPHVESSFNTYAYSKVGAAGMWQFMRSTGRRYLRIDNVIDERLDPYKSTEAAARFLEQNYSVLQSWPLALTAYNHGAAGMRRAKESMRTDDIAKIVRNYKSRTFGFASRNFYVAFLAALEIDSNPDKFFGPIQRNAVDSSQIATLPEFTSVRGLVSALGVDMEEIQRLNPSLLPAVWTGSRHVPRGYELRIPATIDLGAALARVPSTQRFSGQLADTHHQVRRGESLSTIASRYSVPLATLAELNGLRRPYTLQVGQALLLPDNKRDGAVLAAAGQGGAPDLAEDIEPATAVAAAAPGAVAAVAGTEGEDRYVVRRGDALSRIATRHGLSEERLLELNGIRNRNYIYEGQVLSVTQASAAARAPSSAAVVQAVVEVASAPVGPTAATEAAEPTTENEADALGPTLVPGVQAAVSADPSDYSVAGDGMVRVEAAETLGHYADWLGVTANRLRELNRMKPAAPVVVGRRLKLDFTAVSQREFEDKRSAYHQQLQETFFAQYRIVGSEMHVVRAGDSVWVLAQRRFNVPIWLLRQYNPDIDFGDVRPGTQLVIPHLEAVATGSAT